MDSDPTMPRFTKTNPGAFDIYADLKPDEPYFLLRGTDSDAAAIIHIWAHLRRRQILMGMRDNVPEEHRQIANALLCAQTCEGYAAEHATKRLISRMTFDDKGNPATIDGYEIARGKKGS